MSYCRFSSGWNEKTGKATLGDVYLYGDMNGMFCCCACKFLRDMKHSRDLFVWMPNRSSAILHLEHHKLAGHKFPSYAIKNLEKELIEEGERFQISKKEYCMVCTKITIESEKQYKKRWRKLFKAVLKNNEQNSRVAVSVPANRIRTTNTRLKKRTERKTK